MSRRQENHSRDQSRGPTLVDQPYSYGQDLPPIPPIREESAHNRTQTGQSLNSLNRRLEAMDVSAYNDLDFKNVNEASKLFDRHPTSPTQSPAQEDECILQKRYIPLTLRTIPTPLLDKLCSLFQLDSSEVKGWLSDGLIRIDLQKWKENKMPYDMEPLTAKLAPRDIENWDQFVSECENNKKFKKYIGAQVGSYREYSSRREMNSSPWPLRGVMSGYDSRCCRCWWSGNWCGGLPFGLFQSCLNLKH